MDRPQQVRADKPDLAAVADRIGTRTPWPDPPGGSRPGRSKPGPTRAELYDEARRRGIRGRSRMTKSELDAALRR